MKKLSEVEGRSLYWVQPKSQVRFFELRVEDSFIVATLGFEKSTGTLATAQVAGESWTFKRVGFFNPRVTVRRAGSEENIAVYEPRFWADGILRLESGREYRWTSTNFWSTQWSFQNPNGTPVFTFKPAKEKTWKDIFKTQAMVDVEGEAWKLRELGLLVLLGWYLVIKHQDDMTVSAAATIAAMS